MRRSSIRVPAVTVLRGIVGAIAVNITIALTLQAQQTNPSTPGIETTGTPGSPSATTTINGSQLPAPDPKFGGVIKDNASQSKAWWAPRVVPPKGAPTCY